MVQLDGDLDPETGETFMTAIRAVLDAEARSDSDGRDERTPAQTRSASSVGGWLDRSDRPEVAGERPHLSVTVPMQTLSDDRSGLVAELDHTGPTDAETLRRLACDASVSRVVLSPRSEPIDVGRKTQVVTPAIRRAVIARDRHCRFPSCDRPQSWCDAHHVVHWADGGETSVANLVLLCRRHHRLVHTRFAIEMVDGRPLFRRGDGSVLADRSGRAPPSGVS